MEWGEKERVLCVPRQQYFLLRAQSRNLAFGLNSSSNESISTHNNTIKNKTIERETSKLIRDAQNGKHMM